MNVTMASEQAAPTGATAPAARIVNGVKVYGAGVTAVRALDGVSADFGAGQFTAVMGPSGSGKSTTLHCLAGLDRLTAGQVLLGDVDLGTLDDKGMTLLRRERIGFVFQAFNLIPTLTARGIAVSKQAAASEHLALGSPVRVTFASNASKIYTVQVIYSMRDLTGDYILPLAAARAYFPQALDVDVFVKLAPG